MTLPSILFNRSKTFWAACLIVTTGLIATFTFVRSQTAPPSIPAISLSAAPLFGLGNTDKAAITLALSVEFPTAGSQYSKANTNIDNTYANTTEFIGYYNAESCYKYNDAPTDAPNGAITADYKRFIRSGTATSRMCTDAFSGNFLNWASSSAVDMIRMSLTGGDRSIDTPTLTVLQRAFVSNGDPRCLWNSAEFNGKQLARNGGGAGKYWGAVPAAMITAAGANDIWIANVLNRIFFRAGNQAAGGCTSSSSYSYNLSGPTPQVGPVVQPYATAATAFDTFFPKCGADNQICTFTGIMEVLYGNANGGAGKWVTFPASNGNSTCYDLINRAVDPVPGILKQCYIRPYKGSWTPTPGGPSQQAGPITNPYEKPKTALAQFYACANEGGDCDFSGTREVLYGHEDGGWLLYPAANGISCLTPVGAADPAPGIVKQCYTRAYSGAWKPSTNTNQLNSDGYFYARVSVCDKDASGQLIDDRDYGLCKKYPAGNFKPTGAVQKYSEQLRLAVFGYLIDQREVSNSSARYGGVLRAAMKYVGAKTFDSNGSENTPVAGNAAMEWNESTGVINVDPDNASTASPAFSTSGVINYINKFGRTGPVPGRYKIYDPIAELHNESLRYLQGLQPTKEAVSSITSDMYDGFPAYNTWTDPYAGRPAAGDYSCLRSNIVVVGDRATHDSNILRDRSVDLSQNIPDIAAATRTALKFESNTAGTYVDGQGVTRDISNPNPPNNNPMLDDRSIQGQIVGSAYWARTQDIRGKNWTAQPALQMPGLRVKTLMFDVNYAGQSNDDTYRRTQNQLFTAAKYGGFETNGSGTVYNNYGNPFKRQDGTNDNNVWQNRSSPGDALTYYRQNNARAVLTAFDNIFSAASQSALSIAGTAVASKNISAGGTLLYQSSFDATSWSGDVVAYPVTLAASNSIAVGTTKTWSASARLDALTAPVSSRNIVVGSIGGASSPTATAFTWATIGLTLQEKLNKPSQTALPDNLGKDRLDYLRGDKSKQGTFRTRSSLLGDIINSGVVYQGAPVAPAGATTGFAAFRTANATRTPAVFVGSNDGMMHAFNANTGDELFAYIPSSMGDKLSLLTNLSYNSNHQSYVDASPVVAEAKVGTTDSATDWKSVLVSGTGGGAPGVFALDVTAPSSFSATNVMWEFTKSDDKDMGYVIGRPRIVKLRTSKPGASPATFRYFAAVASGVNNYVSVGGLFSALGNPALFLLALDKPVGAAWRTGDASANYYKILLPVDSTLSATNPTGLINFRPTVAANGETEKIYMGDLHGKLWKLDFTPTTLAGPSDWSMNKLTAYDKGTTANPSPYPLFTAQTAAGGVQPITMAPLVAAGPVVKGLDTAIIGFGTGKYLETSDKASTNKNTFYAIFDDGKSKADTSPAGSSIVSGRGRLQAGTVNTTTFAVTVPTFRFGRPDSDTSTDIPPTKAGFYFDLPDSGERIINDGDINGNFFVVSSLIPVATGVAGSCSSSGGGNAYSINIDTGSSGYQKSTVGLLGDSLVVVVSNTLSPSASTGKAKRTVVTKTLTTGSTGAGLSTGVDLSASQTYDSKRMSWRQISNYKDLFNAAKTP